MLQGLCENLDCRYSVSLDVSAVSLWWFLVLHFLSVFLAGYAAPGHKKLRNRVELLVARSAIFSSIQPLQLVQAALPLSKFVPRLHVCGSIGTSCTMRFYLDKLCSIKIMAMHSSSIQLGHQVKTYDN